jgi:hypothetical protein
VLVLAMCGGGGGGGGGAEVRRCAEGWLEWRRAGVVCVCLCALRWFDASLPYQSVCLQDGKSVVSGSADKTVRVWDAATGKEVQKLEGHSDDVYSVAFSPVRRRRARGRQLRAWCARSVCHVCVYVFVGVLGHVRTGRWCVVAFA